MKEKYRPAKKTYEIAIVETSNVLTGEQVLLPYYKIYSRDDNGGLTFEIECETISEAYDYIFKERENEQN